MGKVILMKENKMSYTESHKGKNDGFIYDNYFYNTDTYDNRIWEIEKNILDNFLSKIDKNKDVLDFACGTGRITKFIENLGFKNIYGFDVSNEMLKIASTKLNRTRLINININKEDITKYKNKFALVTVFRFFLNAENKLKDITFSNIHQIMEKDGYLIFNIHGNKKSLRYFYVFLFNITQGIRYAVLKRKKHSRKQLSISEVKKYLVKHNFELIEIISYSFLTKFFYFLLPKNLFIYLEKLLSSKKLLFGTHLIFLAKKI